MLEIITPRAENEHGCQVSVLVFENGKHVFDMLRKNSVIADWREPDVIRVAPVPLYNTFEEVYQFGEIIGNYLSAKN
jgi:kynureninase